MKKLLLFLLLLTSTITKAQIGGGYDFALNFGGAGSTINEMRYDANGNLFFTATIWGKCIFAGTQLNPGGYGTQALNEVIYGKISPDGTQTLLKRNIGSLHGRFDADGNLYAILSVGFPTAPVDYGNGIINNTNGVKLLKISNTGVAQWMKNIDTGSDVLSGESGKAAATITGMQITPDGNIFAVIAANNPSRNPPNAQFTYPNRIIKFNPSGDELWHTDVFSYSLYQISVPRIFVDDAGQVTFGLYNNDNKLYYNGEAIASQMSNYLSSAYSIVISLNADGSKKSAFADTKSSTAIVVFEGLNPINGNLYLNYSFSGNVKPTEAPFKDVVPIVQGGSTYAATGIMGLNSAGQYLDFKTAVDYKPNYEDIFRYGSNFVSIANKSANSVYEQGNYLFNDAKNYSVIEFLDQDFNFVKAFKVPESSIAALFQNKVAFGGAFKGNLTFGTTTLTQSFNDTDFQTLYPSYASLKADIFIAVADTNSIVTPAPANWLGVDNNWNNTANWSTGLVPDVSTIVKFNANTAQIVSSPKNSTV
ncbi:MAG: hypothetical protein IE931_15100 [Sphingobacteriales bacterium]|nr:hypothetical protein [Sphingobacteriales bacterium]